MEIKEIIYICFIVISTLSFIIKTVISDSKAKKEERKLTDIINISDTILGFIEEAEKKFATTKKSGETKKEVVMTKVNNMCITLGLPFEEEYWSEKVDAYLELTKVVNK